MDKDEETVALPTTRNWGGSSEEDEDIDDMQRYLVEEQRRPTITQTHVQKQDPSAAQLNARLLHFDQAKSKIVTKGSRPTSVPFQSNYRM